MVQKVPHVPTPEVTSDQRTPAPDLVTSPEVEASARPRLEDMHSPAPVGKHDARGFTAKARAAQKRGAAAGKAARKRENNRMPEQHRKSPTLFDVPRKEIYLEELARCGLKTKAAVKAGIHYETVVVHRRGDKTFAELEKVAMQMYADTLAQEAHRRAVDGVEKMVYQRGQQVMDSCEHCYGTGIDLSKDKRPLAQIPFKERMNMVPCVPCKGTGNKGPAIVTEHSDRLLERLMMATDNRFRDKQITEVNIAGGVLIAPGGKRTAKALEDKWSGKTIDVTEESGNK